MSSGSSSGLEGDAVSEAFELGDEAAGGAFGVAAAEVVAAGFAVELTGCEHVPAGAEDRVLDGAGRAAVAAAGSQPLVLGGEVDVAAAGRCQRRLGQRGVEPLGAVPGFAGAAFAGRAIIAWALAGPAGEVPLGGEAAHVGADLRDDHLGCALLDAGDRAEQLNRRGERASCASISSESSWICSSRKSRWARIAETISACWRSKRPTSASLSAGIFARSFPCASSARTCGSVVPCTSASSIARPEAPRMSLATQSSLIPVSSRILCNRLPSR